MAAPDPARGLLRARACRSAAAGGRGRGTRPIRPRARGRSSRCSAARSPTAPRQVLRRALERVVHQLGRVEELLAPVDHLPLAVEADVAHQRRRACRGSPRRRRRTRSRRCAPPAGPAAARPARGSRRSAPCRRCGCSRRASCGRRRRAGARGGTIPNRARSSARSRGMRTRGRRLRSRGCSTDASTARRSCRSLLALAIAAFSLTARPQPLTSTLAPDAFDGARAFAELKSLAARIPRAAPGQRRRRGARRARRADAGRARRHRAAGAFRCAPATSGADDRRRAHARRR